ncbi:MAG: lipopolysaccharide export system permease protein [Halieaceae bacterium]|jgi:lipopolysaccharide export system permease protein
MRLINRYFGNTIFSAILLVLLVLVGLDGLAAVIDESKDIQAKYTFHEVLIYVMYSLPGRVYQYIPFATLIGCLTGLGSLASSSEVIVVRTAGLSVGKVVWIVMKPAVVVMIASLFIGEYIAPKTEQIAQSRRALAESGTESFTSRRGLWNREGNQFMHFNAVQPSGVLYGVTLMDFDDSRQLTSLAFARRASYQEGYWLLEGVEETRLTETNATRVEEHTRRWESELTPQLLNFVIVRPEKLSMSGLQTYGDYLHQQGLDAGDYRLAFWGKALQPLAIFGLVLVAVSFVFGPLRGSTMGFKIFTGVLVGIAFSTSQNLMGPASLVYGFSPLHATLLPIVLCILTGLLMLSRTR